MFRTSKRAFQAFYQAPFSAFSSSPISNIKIRTQKCEANEEARKTHKLSTDSTSKFIGKVEGYSGFYVKVAAMTEKSRDRVFFM